MQTIAERDVMEVWRQVKGWARYEVSSEGNVRRVYGCSSGRPVRYKTLQICVKEDGYCRIHVSDGKIRKWLYVHRIVAEKFVANPLDKPEVNHKDGIKSNNRFENLEWSTRSENAQHMFDVLGVVCR